MQDKMIYPAFFLKLQKTLLYYNVFDLTLKINIM